MLSAAFLFEETMMNERDLEDFICEHPEYVLWEGVEIIGRQVPTEHGRLDVLAWDGRALVIELKARPIREKDIGQVLRYAHDVRAQLQRVAVWNDPLYSRLDKEASTIEGQFFARAWGHYHGLSDYEEQAISPILIGTDIDRSVKAACEAAGINTRLWHYNPNNNEIAFAVPDRIGWGKDADNELDYPGWVMELHNRIVQICVKDAESLFTSMAYELFGLDDPEDWHFIPYKEQAIER